MLRLNDHESARSGDGWMRLKGKRKSTFEQPCVPASRWLTTFNDLVTLLMVFFVLLFSMSVIDARKVKQFQAALQSGLGVLEAGEKVPVAVVDSRDHRWGQSGVESGSAEHRQTVGKLEHSIRQVDKLDGLAATFEKGGIVISLDDRFLFAPGQARLHPASSDRLDKVAGLIRKTAGSVRVEGHTDNMRIHNRQFPSNWELSCARAVSVLNHLITKGNVEPRRLSAVGYGAAKPVASNATPAGRAMNRRVEIVLLRED